MDEPLYVVRNTSRDWFTTVNHELFLYDDRLVSVRGLTMRTGRAAARRRRTERGRTSLKEGWQGQGEDADRRVADVLATPEEAVLERPGSTRVAVADVTGAAARSPHRNLQARVEDAGRAQAHVAMDEREDQRNARRGRARAAARLRHAAAVVRPVSGWRAMGMWPRVLMTRAATAAGLLAIALAAAAPAHAQAPTPEIPLNFSATSLLSGQGFTVSGVLPGGAADAGRPVQLYERRSPFPGAYAIVSNGSTGPSGEFVFSVTPVRKAYWAVVAPVTTTRPREASPGFLVAVRRQVSIRTSTRRPRKGRLVRFSGFVSPGFPVGPGSVATLQRRNRQGGFSDVRAVLLKAAGTFSSYRLRLRVNRSGVYRVVVPSSTFFSAGASVAVTVRMRR